MINLQMIRILYVPCIRTEVEKEEEDEQDKKQE